MFLFFRFGFRELFGRMGGPFFSEQLAVDTVLLCVRGVEHR